MGTSFEAFSGKFEIPSMDRVWYGPNCLNQLAEEVERLHIRKAFVIASKSIRDQTDLVARLKEVLGDGFAGVSAESKQHVPRQAVLHASDEARKAGADALISLGGGSQIDCAKAVALCLAENISTREQLDDYRVRYEPPDKVTIPALKGTTVPHLALPTTISAAEFTNFIGITDEARMVKDLYIDSQLTPKAVFLDPMITVSTPSWLWASTGMRAVDHCAEAYISLTHTPFNDALALGALQTLFAHLPAATKDPDNVDAKARCQWAAWMSIFGLANVLLGLSHGIGHQLGARCAMPHGVTSCVMLPHVLEFNLPVTMERQAELARAMGVDTQGLTSEQAARAGIAALRSFIEELQLPSRLRDANVTKEDFDAIVHDAMEDLIVATNPRPATAEDVYALLESAY